MRLWCDSRPAACASRKNAGGFRVRDDVGGDGLDRDAASDDRIDRFVHASHASFAKDADDLVLADGFHGKGVDGLADYT